MIYESGGLGLDMAAGGGIGGVGVTYATCD